MGKEHSFSEILQIRAMGSAIAAITRLIKNISISQSLIKLLTMLINSVIFISQKNSGWIFFFKELRDTLPLSRDYLITQLGPDIYKESVEACDHFITVFNYVTIVEELIWESSTCFFFLLIITFKIFKVPFMLFLLVSNNSL